PQPECPMMETNSSFHTCKLRSLSTTYSPPGVGYTLVNSFTFNAISRCPRAAPRGFSDVVGFSTIMILIFSLFTSLLRRDRLCGFVSFRFKKTLRQNRRQVR